MLLELFGQDDVPESWADPNQVRNIDVLKSPDQVFAAADKQNIISKTHSYERDFIEWMRRRGARFVTTKRNKVEILASHYHHFSKEKIHLPTRVYAATVGFVKAIEVVLYEQIATDPSYADMVIDFSRLKADSEQVLTEIVVQFGLDYSPQQISKAAARANMRNRDYGDTFAGMEERAWFFRRDDSSLNEHDRKALSATLKFAQRLVAVGPIAKALTALFLLDPRRGKFLRYVNARSME